MLTLVLLHCDAVVLVRWTDLLREELRDVHHLFKKDANFRRMINQGRSEELPASDFTKVLLGM